MTRETLTTLEVILIIQLRLQNSWTARRRSTKWERDFITNFSTFYLFLNFLECTFSKFFYNRIILFCWISIMWPKTYEINVEIWTQDSTLFKVQFKTIFETVALPRFFSMFADSQLSSKIDRHRFQCYLYRSEVRSIPDWVQIPPNSFFDA